MLNTHFTLFALNVRDGLVDRETLTPGLKVLADQRIEELDKESEGYQSRAWQTAQAISELTYGDQNKMDEDFGYLDEDLDGDEDEYDESGEDSDYGYEGWETEE